MLKQTKFASAIGVWEKSQAGMRLVSALIFTLKRYGYFVMKLRVFSA
jgi:hypothetical protein